MRAVNNAINLASQLAEALKNANALINEVNALGGIATGNGYLDSDVFDSYFISVDDSDPEGPVRSLRTDQPVSKAEFNGMVTTASNFITAMGSGNDSNIFNAVKHRSA